MFKGLFLLEDYEPLKGMDPFFYLFFCLSVLTGRFGDSGVNSYEAFLEPAWGTVPVTLGTRVLLLWPWCPPAYISPFPDFPVLYKPAGYLKGVGTPVKARIKFPIGIAGGALGENI